MTKPPTPLTLSATAGLKRLMEGDPTPERLAGCMRYLAKWRSQMLEATILARSGEVVQSGPFKGMLYPVTAAEGSRVSRLLGVYEASLIPVIEKIIARGYPTVMDVGCAEGYYAVGLALRMPQTRVLARDLSGDARERCARMAAANGVTDRVEIGGEVTAKDFDLCGQARTLVLCDIEGAEDALIDPATAPGLCHADILIEVHEGFRPGLLGRIAERFRTTHWITRIGRSLADDALPEWSETLSDLDRLLMMWEWRSSPTPWLWMEKI
jgi:hypothetical protein